MAAPPAPARPGPTTITASSGEGSLRAGPSRACARVREGELVGVRDGIAFTNAPSWATGNR